MHAHEIYMINLRMRNFFTLEQLRLIVHLCFSFPPMVAYALRALIAITTIAVVLQNTYCGIVLQNTYTLGDLAIEPTQLLYCSKTLTRLVLIGHE